MGDCLYTFPLVSAVKDRFPGAEVSWIVEGQHQDIPWLHRGVNDVIVVNTKRWRREFWSGRLGGVLEEIGTIGRLLKARAFDIALDPQGLIKSGVIAWLTRAPVRVGFTRGACREGLNTLFTTHRVDPSSNGHIVNKNLSLLAALDIWTEKPDFGIRVPADAEARVCLLLRQAGISPSVQLVGIHPGVGHPSKRWDPDRYAQVGDLVQERTGARILLTGGAGEEELVRRVASQMRTAPMIIPPLQVGELVALFSRYDLLIAGDTGPLHLAAALGRPTVAIYGPSDPVRVAPVGQAHVVLKKPCVCGWEPKLHFNRHCPDVPCLGAITVGEVAAAAMTMLASRSTVG